MHLVANKPLNTSTDLCEPLIVGMRKLNGMKDLLETTHADPTLVLDAVEAFLEDMNLVEHRVTHAKPGTRLEQDLSRLERLIELGHHLIASVNVQLQKLFDAKASDLHLPL